MLPFTETTNRSQNITKYHSNTFFTARERIPPSHYRLEQAHCSQYRQGNVILQAGWKADPFLMCRAPRCAPWASLWWGARWSRGSRGRCRGACWRMGGWCPPPPPSRRSAWGRWTSTPGTPPPPTLMMSPCQTWSETDGGCITQHSTHCNSRIVILCVFKERLNKRSTRK